MTTTLKGLAFLPLRIEHPGENIAGKCGGKEWRGKMWGEKVEEEINYLVSCFSNILRNIFRFVQEDY